MDLNLRKVRKWIAQLMTVVMVLTSAVFIPTNTVQAAPSNLPSFNTAKAISSIKYDFNIANAVSGSSITFKMMDSNWVEHSQTIQLTANGAYSVSFDLGNASGIVNMGSFVTDTNNAAVATLSKVTVNNGTYQLTYNATLKVNSTWENSLNNIWNGLTDEQIIAQGANGYIAFKKGTSDLLVFYTVYPPTATTISTIKYDFNIANAVNGSNITFKMMDSNWVEHSQTIQLTANGAYSVSFGLGNASGIINMGYFATDTNNAAVATLSKVTVNGRYELAYNATLKVNSTWENSLNNIWSELTDGQMIAQGTNGYIAFTKGTSDLFIFYTEALSSQAYVEAMGEGFNVFNTFDSYSDDFAQSSETSWGQPVVTQDYIKAAKAKGLNSIRIPMTAYSRYTLGADGHYAMNSEWLTRYKQVVDWAVAEGFYVMINLHHDSWTWLSDWNGDKSAEEYKRFVDLWSQLANYFKDEPNTVCFETINEPLFESDTGSITKQDKLNMINKAAHDVIRNTGGNNATRMIVMPTINTSSDTDKANSTYSFITSLSDPNIIATVHFYSDWVYSANLGITNFDEPLYTDSPDTPRTHVDLLYNTLINSFTSKGVGVVIGEYGWLAPNDGPAANQPGEKLKYFEYMNYVAKQKGICPMVWPGVFDRISPYSWDTLLGPVVNAAVQGQRSSYSTGLNENYINQTLNSGLQIPLTLNGNIFSSIAGLTAGADYTYDAATATVTLSKDFVNSKYNALAANAYGTIADLVLQFSSGADWHQYLIKYTTPAFQTATGGATSGLNIPVTFNGSKLRRASAHDAAGNRIGPTSWFTYDKFGDDFTADNTKISILPGFLSNSSVLDGTIKFTFEFYDGQVINYSIQKSGSNVTGIGVVN